MFIMLLNCWYFIHYSSLPLCFSQILSFPEYSSSPVFQMPRTSLQDPTTPQAHLEASSAGYIAPEERSPPPHSSASLIKAIREELQRLSQKQVAVVSYHS